MQFLLLILMTFQTAPSNSAAPAAAPVRGDRFEIIVPQGWKTLMSGGDVVLEHSTGASLLVRRITQTKTLAAYAQQQAERVMSPIGFAKLGEPKSFKDDHDELVQYEIFGNRLSEHHRVLYRALRRDNAFYEFVFEAGEDHFDALLTEAQAIASSVQAIMEAPPVRRGRR